MSKKILFLCGLLLAQAASAYILPANSIVRRMAAKRDDLQVSSFTVKGSVVLSGDASVAAAAALGVDGERTQLVADAKVLLKVPGRCRLELASAESTKVLAAIRSGGRTRSEGPSLSALTVTVESVCALLAIRSSSDNESRQAIEKILSTYKVEARKTSLARLGGHVAYVLGDVSDRAPQLWVYKDSFLPARLRYKDASGNFWDIRLVGFSSPGTGEVFPRQVEVAKNGTTLLKLTASDGDSASSVEDKNF